MPTSKFKFVVVVLAGLLFGGLAHGQTDPKVNSVGFQPGSGGGKDTIVLFDAQPDPGEITTGVQISLYRIRGGQETLLGSVWIEIEQEYDEDGFNCEDCAYVCEGRCKVKVNGDVRPGSCGALGVCAGGDDKCICSVNDFVIFPGISFLPGDDVRAQLAIETGLVDVDLTNNELLEAVPFP